MKYPILRFCKHGEYLIINSKGRKLHDRLKEEGLKLCELCQLANTPLTSPQAHKGAGAGGIGHERPGGIAARI